MGADLVMERRSAEQKQKMSEDLIKYGLRGAQEWKLSHIEIVTFVGDSYGYGYERRWYQGGHPGHGTVEFFYKRGIDGIPYNCCFESSGLSEIVQLFARLRGKPSGQYHFDDLLGSKRPIQYTADPETEKMLNRVKQS